MKFNLCVILSLLFVPVKGCFPPSGLGVSKMWELQQLENNIYSLMDKYHSIGLSVVVVKDNRILYHHSFGYKDRENMLPLNDGDIFRIASVSKTFTATAIMQLVEKNLLALDDNINKYLGFKVENPEFPNKPITIKMLLSHRSSINDKQGWIKTSFDNINPNKNEKFGLCYNHYEPGGGYDYCNLNYELLGAVVENVTGQRFDSYILKNIVEPLKLNGSFNSLDVDSELFVKSYRFYKQEDSLKYNFNTYDINKEGLIRYIKGYNTSIFSPASGMKISAVDLAKYMIMYMNYGNFLGKNIINEESVSQLWKVQTKEKNYALSFKHYPNIINKINLIGQTGGLYGIHTSMIFSPKEKFGFVVFCNGCKSKYPDGADLSNTIIRQLFNFFIE